MLTTAALTAIANAIIAMVSSAKVVIGGTAYTMTVVDSGVSTSPMELYVRLRMALDGSQSGTLTKVTLYNSSNNIIWEKTENMNVDSAALSLEYLVTIALSEVI